MNRHKCASAALASLLLSSLALPGCVVVPDQRHYVDGVVMVAPPPPRDEAVAGVEPTPGYVWFGGYWSWVGGRYEWMAGHWAAGRPGYHWVNPEWVRQGDGWRMKSGHWARS